MFEESIYKFRFRLTSMLDERRPLDGLLGLPAMFVLILLAFMGWNSRSEANIGQLKILEKSAQGHLDSGRFMEARIVAKRLASADEKNLKAVLIEVKALRGMGKEREASRLLSRVAPLSHPGNAAAHVMQAAILLTQEKADPNVVRQHVAYALQADPSNQDALELAARLSAGAGQWKEVLKHLDQMSLEKRADLKLMKATAMQYSGMKNEAVKFAREAEESLRELNESVSEGGDRVRYSIAISLGLQCRFEQAEEWMMKSNGGKLNKEDRQVLGGIYLAWSRHLKEQGNVDTGKVLGLLEKGIQTSADSEEIVMEFLKCCESFSANPEERNAYMQRVLGNGGISTSFLHYYMGVQDWKQGSRESAKSHFELASTLNPGFKVITNNLAMAIASTSKDDGELERALAMMDELIRQDPANPHFLDTRGQVHARMRQFKKAVVDLEQALPLARDKDSIHAKLAVFYEQLGMPDLAMNHRSAAPAGVAGNIQSNSNLR